MLGFLLAVALASTASSTPAKSDGSDPTLRPFLATLRAETSAENLKRIAALDEDDLIVLHASYGRTIRNKWLWGDREPALINYFRERGINHPDGMSQALIVALWKELNAALPAS